MSVAEGSSAPLRKAPFYLELRPPQKRDEPSWWACLEDDILTLVNPSDSPVLTVHRHEAARYVRVKHDLLKGHILTFAIAEGLKKHSFLIGKDHLARLLTWFPHKQPAERIKDVRQSSALVCLFGILHLVLNAFLTWEWGVVLLLAGAVGLFFPTLRCHALNGAVLALAGLWSLFPWTAPGLDPRSLPLEAQLIPVVAGSLLIVWGIQQFAMLTVNHELRSARAIRDRRVEFAPGRSRLVHRVAAVAIVEGILLGVYALVALALWLLRDTPIQPGQPNPFIADVVAAGGMGVLLAGVGTVLLYGRSAMHREAKVAGQLVIVSGILGLWATGFALAEFFSMQATGFYGLVGARPGLFVEPYVWGSFIPFVLAYNRWFGRAVDRDLEELRN